MGVNARITVSGTFSVNEVELRALDALVGYGIDPFLDVFYKQLGAAYLQPHEKGLRSLFKTIREQVPKSLREIDDARDWLKRKAQEKK